MIYEGLEIKKQVGVILLISIHAVLSSHQAQSKERGDKFDIGYNSTKYGEIIKHPTKERYFCKIRKGKVKTWVKLIESVMTDEQKDLLGDVPDVFRHKDL